MKLLSIVIPFYNRRQLLINVLRSICYFKKDYPIEVIIVDDGSTHPETIPDVAYLFPSLDINLIIIKRNKLEKKRTPVVAYNTGFNAATGDVILINSAECIHTGNIIGYVFNNLNPKSYLAFATYQGTYELNEIFNKLNWLDPDVMIYAHIAMDDLQNGWHSHSSHQTFIPFCAAINREDLEILSGYDERFIKGIGYDDYDFTDRIENLGLAKRLIDSPFCVHQMHPSTVYSNTINIDLLSYLRKTKPKRIKALKNKFYVR